MVAEKKKKTGPLKLRGTTTELSMGVNKKSACGKSPPYFFLPLPGSYFSFHILQTR